MSVANPCRGFVFALVITASLETASARIGWTLEECVRQYGEFSATEPEDGSYSFSVGNISIVANPVEVRRIEVAFRESHDNRLRALRNSVQVNDSLMGECP
jgi:hypothetical protein